MGAYYNLVNSTKRQYVSSYWKGSPPSIYEVYIVAHLFGWDLTDTINSWSYEAGYTLCNHDGKLSWNYEDCEDYGEKVVNYLETEQETKEIEKKMEKYLKEYEEKEKYETEYCCDSEDGCDHEVKTKRVPKVESEYQKEKRLHYEEQRQLGKIYVGYPNTRSTFDHYPQWSNNCCSVCTYKQNTQYYIDKCKRTFDSTFFGN
ncbi:MAG: hypothetical protein Terrestrivirus1_250 [Terrestrivirus sp.]|jgi:hypothetical protein|uniref:Uncharacterized protein n=1 Tax=Terrestrivirus sp. TaxID=2487775 RepID=A0A3G4ZKK8_9VIRU|nr:MAG: hypothetical protein Terrestrivirus1_250 [Terrestrivirus sp.]